MRERAVRVERVGADADDLGAGLDEVLVGVAEGAGLDGAAGRVVLGIEEEHDVLLAGEVRERDLAAAQRGQAEVGGALAHRHAHELTG